MLLDVPRERPTFESVQQGHDAARPVGVVEVQRVDAVGGEVRGEAFERRARDNYEAYIHGRAAALGLDPAMPFDDLVEAVASADEDMQSVSLKTDKPLNPDKFFPWVQDLVATEGQNILRCKGILAFKDDPERYVFQGVHMILDGDHQRPWKEGEARDSRIVFIGRELPLEKIQKGFESCVA